MRVDDTQREIAKRVRDAIDRAGISQSELARRLGWPQPRLNRRLTNADYSAPFTAAELVDVAALLGVQVSDLYPDPERCEHGYHVTEAHCPTCDLDVEGKCGPYCRHDHREAVA